MDVSHKHLNISDAEWAQFMAIFHDVCGEFALARDDVAALDALLASMKADCVVGEGEQPWPEPKPSPAHGGRAYRLAGGVYPIALFVDRLVDALLADERVNIPVDGTKRNEASLKCGSAPLRFSYILREFLENIPENPALSPSGT